MNHADIDVDSRAPALADLATGSPGSRLSGPSGNAASENGSPEDASKSAQRENIGAVITDALSPHPTLWQFDIDSSMRIVDSRAPSLSTSALVIAINEHGVSVGHPSLDVQIRSIVMGAFDGQSRQVLLESARGAGCRLMVVARHRGEVVRLELLDLDARLRFPEELLADLFSLTQTESIIVHALVNGQTLREYAESNSVSRNTVRTHLKSVFMKTRTHRQADLVKLVQLVCMSYPHHSDAL